MNIYKKIKNLITITKKDPTKLSPDSIIRNKTKVFVEDDFIQETLEVWIKNLPYADVSINKVNLLYDNQVLEEHKSFILYVFRKALLRVYVDTLADKMKFNQDNVGALTLPMEDIINWANSFCRSATSAYDEWFWQDSHIEGKEPNEDECCIKELLKFCRYLDLGFSSLFYQYTQFKSKKLCKKELDENASHLAAMFHAEHLFTNKETCLLHNKIYSRPPQALSAKYHGVDKNYEAFILG